MGAQIPRYRTLYKDRIALGLHKAEDLDSKDTSLQADLTSFINCIKLKFKTTTSGLEGQVKMKYQQ